MITIYEYAALGFGVLWGALVGLLFGSVVYRV